MTQMKTPQWCYILLSPKQLKLNCYPQLHPSKKYTQVVTAQQNLHLLHNKICPSFSGTAEPV